MKGLILIDHSADLPDGDGLPHGQAVLDLPDLPLLGPMRAWVHEQVEDLSERAVDDVVLVACELVANAYQHAQGPRQLRIDRVRRQAATLVRLSLTDASTAWPRLRASGENGGFGLRVVGKLSVSWGTMPHPPGKTVWADLSAY